MDNESQCRRCKQTYYAGRQILDWYCWMCVADLIESGEWTKWHAEQHKKVING